MLLSMHVVHTPDAKRVVVEVSLEDLRHSREEQASEFPRPALFGIPTVIGGCCCVRRLLGRRACDALPAQGCHSAPCPCMAAANGYDSLQLRLQLECVASLCMRAALKSGSVRPHIFSCLSSCAVCARHTLRSTCALRAVRSDTVA